MLTTHADIRKISILWICREAMGLAMILPMLSWERSTGYTEGYTDGCVSRNNRRSPCDVVPPGDYTIVSALELRDLLLPVIRNPVLEDILSEVPAGTNYRYVIQTKQVLPEVDNNIFYSTTNIYGHVHLLGLQDQHKIALTAAQLDKIEQAIAKPESVVKPL